MAALFDSHTHSVYSHDCDTPLQENLATAAKQGLLGLCTTDHCEVNCFDAVWLQRLQSGRQQLAALRPQWAGQLVLTQGIELAYPQADPVLARQIIAAAPYDFVLGSMHGSPAKKGMFDPATGPRRFAQILRTYFGELLQVVQLDCFDVLAHLTYPLRYASPQTAAALDLSAFDRQIDEIFAVLIKNGRGLELNVSGLYQSYGKPFPTVGYLRRFYQLGGRIVTLGSDAHHSADIGRQLAAGAQLLRQAGFTAYCYFRGRRPVFLDL